MFLKYKRRYALAGFLISVGALAGAVWLQQVENWAPCPLCIIQRYLYLLTAFGFLGLAWSGKSVETSKTHSGYFLFLGMISLAGLVGVCVASYHVWILAHPGQTCGVDPLQVKLNHLPWAHWVPDLFISDGFCTDPYPPILGLSLPAWSGVGFLLQLGLVFAALRSFMRTRRAR